jgi:hypothetical protein
MHGATIKIKRLSFIGHSSDLASNHFVKSWPINFLFSIGACWTQNLNFLTFCVAFHKLKCNSYLQLRTPNLCDFEGCIKRDQLDVTCFFISLFSAQHVSDINTSILRSLRVIYGVISWDVLLWYDACWCYVVVWMGWCGIRIQASACIRTPHHTTPAKPQRNTNTHRTRAIHPMK